MKTLIISGPSGSGKTFLTKRLVKFFKESIVLKTDDYYKDTIFIKFLSRFIFDIYDRPISIKRYEIMKNLKSIYNRSSKIQSCYYDFKKKKSLKRIMNLNYNIKNQFLIIEGIFAHRLDLNYHDTINIVCKQNKKICQKRRLKRDQIERGRSNNEVNNRFSRSWNLFYYNVKEYINYNNTITIDTSNKVSYDDLIIKLMNINKQKN